MSEPEKLRCRGQQGNTVLGKESPQEGLGCEVPPTLPELDDLLSDALLWRAAGLRGPIKMQPLRQDPSLTPPLFAAKVGWFPGEVQSVTIPTSQAPERSRHNGSHADLGAANKDRYYDAVSVKERNNGFEQHSNNGRERHTHRQEVAPVQRVVAPPPPIIPAAAGSGAPRPPMPSNGVHQVLLPAPPPPPVDVGHAQQQQQQLPLQQPVHLHVQLAQHTQQGPGERRQVVGLELHMLLKQVQRKRRGGAARLKCPHATLAQRSAWLQAAVEQPPVQPPAAPPPPGLSVQGNAGSAAFKATAPLPVAGLTSTTPLPVFDLMALLQHAQRAGLMVTKPPQMQVSTASALPAHPQQSPSIQGQHTPSSTQPCAGAQEQVQQPLDEHQQASDLASGGHSLPPRSSGSGCGTKGPMQQQPALQSQSSMEPAPAPSPCEQGAANPMEVCEERQAADGICEQGAPMEVCVQQEVCVSLSTPAGKVVGTGEAAQGAGTGLAKGQGYPYPPTSSDTSSQHQFGILPECGMVGSGSVDQMCSFSVLAAKGAGKAAAGAGGGKGPTHSPSSSLHEEMVTEA